MLLALFQLLQAKETRQIQLRGKLLTLAGIPLHIGKPMPNISLPDLSLNLVSIGSLKGKVTIISVVPSLDTAVCEKQTHILSERNNGLDKKARLITISRDLPFAQNRFTREAKIGNLIYLSDYREGRFGLETGLLIDENRLLARAIIILDAKGIVRYLEIVPNLEQLPRRKKRSRLPDLCSKYQPVLFSYITFQP
tara:strand:+ start:2160 stop:2744 length:585 start_codon:yes stop_codon:yes gene_type:complete